MNDKPESRSCQLGSRFGNNYYQNGEKLHFEPISTAEEQAMFRAAKAGDEKVRENLIVRHLLFAIKQGRRFCANRLPPDETTSAANEALMTAIDRFDCERGTAFRSFLIPYIRAAIAKCWRSREPVDYKHSKPPEMITGRGPEPTVQIAETQPYEQEEHNKFLKGQLLEIATDLPPRDQRVIQLHYVEMKNFAEIGRELGLSREGIRQVHDRVLVLLRKKLTSRGITSSQ